jgi:surfeit locus 1 family protein
MLRFRPLPFLSLFSAIALVVLVLLGNWQWARFQQKTAAAHAPLQEISMTVEGPPRGPVHFLYGVLEGRAGWRIIAPYPVGDDRVLLADVGFLPGLEPPARTGVQAPALAPGASLAGAAIAPRKPSPFAAAPDPDRGLWYDVDLSAMARAAGYTRAEPYLLAAHYSGQPNPFAHLVDPLPPERHVGYAITWWGLAAALLVIYALFHVRRGRLSFERR